MGTLNGLINAPILNLSGPLTGPFSPVTTFAANYPGYFNGTGLGSVLADLNGDTTKPAVERFAPGTLGAGSGAVVLFSDSDAMVAGDSLTSTNLNLVLNSFSLANGDSAVPEPSTLGLVGIALGGLFVVRLRAS
jgi:hypothetical protein